MMTTMMSVDCTHVFVLQPLFQALSPTKHINSTLISCQILTSLYSKNMLQLELCKHITVESIHWLLRFPIRPNKRQANWLSAPVLSSILVVGSIGDHRIIRDEAHRTHSNRIVYNLYCELWVFIVYRFNSIWQQLIVHWRKNQKISGSIVITIGQHFSAGMKIHQSANYINT